MKRVYQKKYDLTEIVQDQIPLSKWNPGRTRRNRMNRRACVDVWAMAAVRCAWCGHSGNLFNFSLGAFVSPRESLLIALNPAGDDGAYVVSARRVRSALRARRGHGPGVLCCYCATRLSIGRDAAEALGESVP